MPGAAALRGGVRPEETDRAMQHVLFLVAGVALVAAGALLLRAVVRGIARQRNLKARLARVEVLARTQERVRARLAGEERTVAALSASLPELVRELNRGDLAPQDVPPLILRLAEAVFRPDRVLLYLRPRGEGGGPDPVLRLAIEKGYGRLPEPLRTVSVGRGRIGWVAQHKREMLDEDWKELARAGSSGVEDDQPSARIDISGPLLHPAGGKEELLGVLCLGSPRIRPRDRRPMFQLVANLGALALVNARHLDELRDMADTDASTGLPNKRWFMGELANMILDAERQARELALLLIEISGFKACEDAGGHAAGARILRRTGELLQGCGRANDRTCYYGGELFAMALPDTGADDALAAAQRIRGELEQGILDAQEPGAAERLAVRCGLACFPVDGNSVPELARSADRALLESRRGGDPVARSRREHARVDA